MARHEAWRWARALTLASVMLACGLTGHVAGGGGAAPAGLLGPMALVLTLAVAPFLEAPASSFRVVVLVLAAQAAIHIILGLVSPTSAMPASMVMPAAPVHQQAGAHVGMLVAHAAAALATALWLAAGERAAWTLLGVVALAVADAWLAIRHVVAQAPAVVAPVRRLVGVVRTDPSRLRRSVWEGRGSLARRGPPYACAIA
jgi:hypothetical protein